MTAIIPARDEAACVGETVTSLLRQDYPGEFTVIVVDDQSRDATAQVAQDAAAALGAGDRLTVLPGRPLPPGWTGKLWAQQQGVALAGSGPSTAGLSAVDRCRYRLRAGCADATRRPRRSAAGSSLLR